MSSPPRGIGLPPSRDHKYSSNQSAAAVTQNLAGVKRTPDVKQYFRGTQSTMLSDNSFSVADSNLSKRTNANLPALPAIRPSDFKGMEKAILGGYMDSDISDKSANESKKARHYLGIGMPEAKSLVKVSGVSTVRSIVSWYFNECKESGTQPTNETVQYAICSSNRTVKVISLLILIGRACGLYDTHVEVDE